MKTILNNDCYDIPDEEMHNLNDYIENVWTPAFEQGLCTDNGIKKIPSNIRALSFTLFLKDYYKDNFSKYKVDCG